MDASCSHRAAACAVLLGILVSASARTQQGKPPAGSQPQQQAAAQELGQISGHVLRADTGEPLPKAAVRLQAIQQGQVDSQVTQTDANGAYSFAGLAPGKYMLFAEHNGFAPKQYGGEEPGRGGDVLNLDPGQNLDKLDMKLKPAGVISGTVIDQDGDPVQGIGVSAAHPRFQPGGREIMDEIRSESTDDLGNFRIFALPSGAYYVSASGSPGGLVYGQVFYPRATSIEEAQVVTVSPGTETRDIRITVSLQHGYTIFGTILDSAQALTAGRYMLRLMQSRNAGVIETTLPMAGMRPTVQPDGSFTARNVPPGDYILEAIALEPRTPPPGAGPNTLSFSQGYTTSVPVHVSDTDVRVTVQMAGPSHIRGAASMEDGTPLPASGLNLGLRPEEVGFGARGANAKVESSGAFDMENVMDGRYHFVVAGAASSPVYVKQVQCGGRDYSAKPLAIDPGASFDDCRVMLANDVAQFTGQVLDGETPVPNLTVIAIPESRELRAVARYTMTSATDGNGQFQIPGVIPGEYELFAVPHDEYDAYYALDFADHNQNSAQRVIIKPRETQTITLKPTNPQ
jgi:uncharacterized GH25 family protein